MNETELWINQARKYLKAARWGGRGLAKSLGDHMTRIDMAQVQRDLGCGEDCAACSWGFLGGHPLPCEPCRLLVLQEAVDDLRKRAADAAPGRRTATTLLQLLDRLPSPRKD